MKMPASGGDPVSTTLRLAFTPSSKAIDLDNGVESSAKRVLLSRIEFEPAANYQSTVLSNLKSKYIITNTKITVNNIKVTNGTLNGAVSKKQNGVSLPVPKLTLFPPERVQLGYRGNLSVGSGMLNMGNTCYLNSTLQALFHVPALVNWLVSETSHQKCEQNSGYQMHPDDITCSVIKTFKCSQQKTGNCMKPVCVYSKLKAICKHLSHGSQEDAHEFMRYLLESLEKSYLIRFQGSKLDSSSKETTPINQIFGGYIRTEVACLSCRAVSTTFQHFQDLPLDIRKASTLDDALAGYFERERLPEGEDAYRCEKCNRKVPATKKFTIEKPPNVLCVQLKRFSMVNGKITKQVQLPQYLDVTRFISPSVHSRHPVRYRLVSMVTHMGQSANCGHYTAIALAANGFYYQFDDTCVRQIPLSTVLNMSAYLVLYEMERPFTPHSPRPFPTHTAVSTWSSDHTITGHATEQTNLTEPTVKAEADRAEADRAREGRLGQLPCKVTPPKPNQQATSLVPYESDEEQEEPASRTELEKLLTKPAWASDKWEVTVETTREGGDNRVGVATTAWDVTDCGESTNGALRKTQVSEAEKVPSRPTNTSTNGTSSSEAADRALCSKLERLADKKKEVVTTLLQQGSHVGYGVSGVKTWNGRTSSLERETDEDRRMERKRRSDEDSYNENFDMGKTKKTKSEDYRRERDRDRPRYNVFQERANQQHEQPQHNQQWRYNHVKYNQQNRYYNKYKRRHCHNNNNRFNGSNNWRNNNNNYNKGHKFGQGYTYYNNYNGY